MIKILILNSGLIFGGAQGALLRWLTLLRNRAQLAMVLCDGANEELTQNIKELGVKLFYVACEKINDLPLMHVSGYENLIRDTDIIWVYDIEFLTAIKLREIINKPIIAHLHSYALVCPWWALFYGMKEICTINCRDNFIRFLTCKFRRNIVRSSIETYEYGVKHIIGTVVKGPIDYYKYKYICIIKLDRQ